MLHLTISENNLVKTAESLHSGASCDRLHVWPIPSASPHCSLHPLRQQPPSSISEAGAGRGVWGGGGVRECLAGPVIPEWMWVNALRRRAQGQTGRSRPPPVSESTHIRQRSHSDQQTKTTTQLGKQQTKKEERQEFVLSLNTRQKVNANDQSETWLLSVIKGLPQWTGFYARCHSNHNPAKHIIQSIQQARWVKCLFTPWSNDTRLNEVWGFPNGGQALNPLHHIHPSPSHTSAGSLKMAVHSERRNTSGAVY